MSQLIRLIRILYCEQFSWGPENIVPVSAAGVSIQCFSSLPDHHFQCRSYPGQRVPVLNETKLRVERTVVVKFLPCRPARGHKFYTWCQVTRWGLRAIKTQCCCIFHRGEVNNDVWSQCCCLEKCQFGSVVISKSSSIRCYFLVQQTFHSQSCWRVIRVTAQFPAFSGTDDMALIGLSAFQGSEKNPQ